MIKLSLLYLTHTNSKTSFNLSTLKDHISKSNYDIDLYVYCNNEELNSIIYEDNYCKFSYNKLQDKLKYKHIFDYSKLYIGNCFLPFIDLYLTHQEYDGYIFYEDDVAYYGDSNMFDLFDFNYDVIFSNKRLFNNCWHWYARQEYHNLTLTPYCELLNIYYMKPYVIKEIYNFMLQGNFAHYEYLFNSFIMCNYEKYEWNVGYLKGNNEFKVNYQDLLFSADDFVHPIKFPYKYQEYLKLRIKEKLKKNFQQ